MGLCPLLPNVSDLTHLRSQTSIQFPKSKEEIELLKALWVMTITDQTEMEKFSMPGCFYQPTL